MSCLLCNEYEEGRHLYYYTVQEQPLFILFFKVYSVGFCVLSRYVERVSETLRQKLKQADILVLKRATMADNRQKALEEQAKLEPRIDLLAKTTRELQKLVNDLYSFFINVWFIHFKCF